MKKAFLPPLTVYVCLVGLDVSAQAPPGEAAAAGLPAATSAVAGDPQDYRVGPGDVLSVAVLQVPELASSVRVSQGGAISLPMVGLVPVNGLTPAEIEARLADGLRRTYVRDPHVTVSVTEIDSHPVSVVGAVAAPGVYQIRRPMRLLEVLSLAQGVTETAGDRILVLQGTEAEESDATTTVDLKQLLESGDRGLNVLVHPGDVVKVPSAQIVYVVGEVNRPGAFPMPRGERLTVLRAVALGEGLTATADKGDVVIIRRDDTGAQVEVGVRLDQIIDAEAPDTPLEANDVLFIPGSNGKAAVLATLDALSRLVVFRPF